jgi:hypothetical protein
MKLKINGLMNDEDILWKKIPCCCGSEIMDKHPIKECKHCKCQAQEDSMPREYFKVNQTVLGKNGEEETIVKEIKEITIDREPVYNSIRGWTF